MKLARMIAWPFDAMKALRTIVARHRFDARLTAERSGLHLGRSVEIRSPHLLKLGTNVIVESGVLLHCGGFAWSGHGGGIVIGDDCYIGPNCVLFGAGGISVGSKSLLSPGVVIASHGHRFSDPETSMQELPSDFKAVALGKNVWVGSNATILPGVTIGDGCVIGAGAVVSRSLPPRSLALGVPARVVRSW